MVLLGVDPHKDTHTVVAVDHTGRQLDQTTVAARTPGHGELLGWARRRWPEERVWAVEDCRHVTGRLERDLLAAGERVVRVPPRLMAGTRHAVRALGKSDPIDALAVARAALREPDLPTAGHDQASWEVRLLVDHREHLVAERTRTINRLRWHLHQLDPDLEHAARSLSGPSLDQIAAWLAGAPSSVQVTICQELTATVAALTARIDQLTGELRQRVARLAPNLLSLPGWGPLTAAKLLAETAGVARFRSEACLPCTLGSHPSRSARDGPTATGCAVAATGSSMLPWAASPSPSYAWWARVRPTTGGGAPRVTAPVTPSARSSDASRALSTSSSSSPSSGDTQQLLPPLDRGAT